MTLRPQPVTSKFRRYYHNEIFPLYRNSNLSHSYSSGGSTASLTSILHHDSFHDIETDIQYNSLDDLPVHFKNQNNPHVPIESLSFEKNIIKTQCIKTKKHNGITRQIISSTYENNENEYRNSAFKPWEKSCKRIIARKPDYPGSRIAHINYDDNLPEKKCNMLPKSANNNHKLSSTKNGKKKENNTSSDNNTNSKPIRKTITKKNNEFSEKGDQKLNDVHLSAKDDANYSLCDFTSVSNSNPAKTLSGAGGTENAISSVDDAHSITVDDTSFISDANTGDGKQPRRIVTAWEDWFLKKEKENRIKQEQERRKMALEDKMKKERESAKIKKREECQQKISEWLQKKENERLKDIKKEKEKKKKKEIEDGEKEDKLKKSSEKYIAWKLKKIELQKEHDQQAKEKLQKQEEELRTKHEKAENAFKKWLETHKDYQRPTPYSYGVSDGKLTSYYDKTSNPPPAYFNPNAWVPVIESKP